MHTYFLQAKVLKAGGAAPAVLKRRLEIVSEAVSERYSDILSAPIYLIDGENFLCKIDLVTSNSLERSGRLVEMICELTLRLTPVKCSFALALEESNLQNAFLEASRNRLFFAVTDFDSSTSKALTGAISAIGGLLWDWTERQSQFVRALLRDGVVRVEDNELKFVKERKRRELSAFFKVSPSVITECLQAASVKRFRYQVYAATIMLEHAVNSENILVNV
jgi:hypothetical protein